MRIWTGLRPVVRAAKILAPAGGIMDLRQFIRSASFQQQNVYGPVLGLWLGGRGPELIIGARETGAP
jgi:hypothetical protein